MSMKKIIAALLALVLCLGLVACGGGNEETKPTTKPTTAPTQSADGFVEVSTAEQVLEKFELGKPGKIKLANDITMDLDKTSDMPLRVLADLTLDLNGHVLTINQYAVGNVISIQSRTSACTFTLMDSSAEGKGVLRGVIAKEGMGRDLIRVNLMDDAQHFVMVALQHWL